VAAHGATEEKSKGNRKEAAREGRQKRKLKKTSRGDLRPSMSSHTREKLARKKQETRKPEGKRKKKLCQKGGKVSLPRLGKCLVERETFLSCRPGGKTKGVQKKAIKEPSFRERDKLQPLTTTVF